MFSVIRKIYDWMGEKVHSPFANTWFFFLFFIESSLFPIPVDPLLILFCIKKRKHTFFYASIATAASVLGGLFGYLIGWALWDSVGIHIVRWFISDQAFNDLVAQYKKYEVLAVLIGGFTPIPYKAVTLSAGFCKLPLIPFMIYSFIARGARFFLVAGAIRLWGKRIETMIDRFFNYLVVAFVLIIALSVSFLKGSPVIQLPMPKIKEIEALAQAKPEALSFAQGALKIGGVDAHVKEYARHVLETDKADYYQAPLGILPLRQKLAEVLSQTNGVRVGIEQVMISHGGVGALLSLGLTLLDHGDEIILPEPAYPVYKNIALLCKATPVFVPVSSMVKKDSSYSWYFDSSAIERAITPATKMIMLSNPCNPTGAVLSREELTTLRRIAEARGIYLVIDEVYDDFIFEGSFASSTASATQSHFVIRIGSFSKNFGMSGWRLGFLVGDVQLIRSLAPVQASVFNCPSVIAQYATLYALEHRQDIIPGYVETVKKSRDILCSFLDKLQARGIIEYAKPTAGFYAFFKMRDQNTYPFVMDLLQSTGVALTPGDDFGQSCLSFVRFCYARDPEMVEEGVARMKMYFAEKQVANYVQEVSQSV